MENLIRFGVSMNANLLEKFDELIARKGYTNRSEAIRDIIRDRLVEEEWQDSDAEVAGTVSIVYNHHVHGLTDVLNDLQHHYQHVIVSSLHVHLDEENCLEVVVVRGKAGEAKVVADRLISVKGVKHGRLSITSTGKNLT